MNPLQHTVRRGGGQKWQNSVHIVVECPPKRELHDGYAFLLLLCQNCIKKKAATDIARPVKCFLSFMNHNWLKPFLMKHP